MSEFHADPATASIGSAIISGALVWLGHRLVGKAAIQEAVNKGFAELMSQMRQELRVALRERDEARKDAVDQHAKIAELRRTIRALELRLEANAILDAEG